MAKATKPGPPPAAKCACGHRYEQHVRGGNSHACQYGAQPPYKDLCPCKRFRPAQAGRASEEDSADSSTPREETG